MTQIGSVINQNNRWGGMEQGPSNVLVAFRQTLVDPSAEQPINGIEQRRQ